MAAIRPLAAYDEAVIFEYILLYYSPAYILCIELINAAVKIVRDAAAS